MTSVSIRLPPLQAIVDVDLAERAGWTPADLASAYLDGGVRFLQVRGKRLASGRLLEICDAVTALAGRYRALVVVNDRVDVARMSGAHGVHVGQEDLSPPAARDQLGPDAIVGYSTHSVAQIEAALREPITYLAVGPVFGTTTKATGYEAVGLELIGSAARLAGQVPIVAIGGVTLENAHAALDAGATSVAVISDLLTGGVPAARAQAYAARLHPRTSNP